MVSILGVDRQLFVVQSLLWVIPVNWLLAIRRSVECLSVTVISRCATILSVQNAEYATRKSTSRFWLVQLVSVNKHWLDQPLGVYKGYIFYSSRHSTFS